MELGSTTAATLTQRLELVHGWYESMVNPASGMLEYLYVPKADTFVRERSPIRDIASVWDLELLGSFLRRDELRPVVDESLGHYQEYLVERDEYLILDPLRLEEPSSIAHSAFMLLALLHASPPARTSTMAALADGILRQQRADGSYKIYFNDLADAGEEFYAGEAMLALAVTYRRLQAPRYLQSVERGFSYYDTHCFRRGRVTKDMLIFFANWQSQACRLLAEHTRDAALAQDAAAYVFRMHDEIIDRGFYEDVARHPTRQVSVEVACGLEGLNDAYAVARSSGNERAERYRRCICTGLAYLLELQRTRDGTARERGGFGMSFTERAQRIDVTGHAASAFMKSVQNEIECGSLAAPS